jgi:hypothetical protein
VEELVKGKPELVSVVGGELVVQWYPLQRRRCSRDEHYERSVDALEQLSGLLPFEVSRLAVDQCVDIGRQDCRRLYRRSEDDVDVNTGRKMALQECLEPIAPPG